MWFFKEVYIVAAVRTPIAAFRGSFSTLTSVDLGAHVAKESLHRAGLRPDEVEETIAGSVLTANQGQNVARQIAIKAGLYSGSRKKSNFVIFMLTEKLHFLEQNFGFWSNSFF